MECERVGWEALEVRDEHLHETSQGEGGFGVLTLAVEQLPSSAMTVERSI